LLLISLLLCCFFYAALLFGAQASEAETLEQQRVSRAEFLAKEQAEAELAERRAAKVGVGVGLYGGGT